MSVVGQRPKPPSQVSAGISISCRNSTSGLNSISGSPFIPRPPRARDRVTMAEDGRAPVRVTVGVGSLSRGAGTEQLAGQIGATYVTVWIRVHIYYQQLSSNY